ncbi:MAG: 50S ribosomal protein L4 [Alistipes sp.]|jgi:large subunit ribosomal protein L4|nr:50S ribosomal protein L4 [Alistipes sp.]
MELKVHDIQGKPTGASVKLADAVFGIEPNDHAIWLDVKQYLAAQRQGTHKSKQRNEVAGSTKKLKRQKGTGGARAGGIKNPLFHGGGRVFGPQPREYGFKLNKKLKALARRSALTYKAQGEAITVVDELNFEAPKTKGFIAVMKALAMENKKVLVLIPEANANVSLSVRNIPNAKVVVAQNANTYELMNAQSLLVSAASVEVLNELLA